MRALLFPGQGSQYIGMGKALAENHAEAKAVFDAVDEALSQKLYALMSEGSADDLNLTENTQPALMAVSLATIAVLEKTHGFTVADKASFVAGHSLGEYSALTAAGALPLDICARLLKLRGQAMQRAAPVGQGAMAAILGLGMDDVKDIAAQANTKTNLICEMANDNSDGQVVLSGHKQAIETAIEIAKDKGAKRALALPVSAPFHCSLMQPAADEMKEALGKTEISAPVVPVVANVLASPTNDPAQIRDLLVQQVTGSVRWRESVEWMGANGVKEAVEIGAGKVLSGLVRRIDRDIACVSIETPEQIEAYLSA